MSHDVFKRQICSGLLEILKDDNLYYESVMGHKYSKFRDKGERALIDYFTMMAPIILDKERQELDKRAKALVVEELKK